jgi:hypothetical protein
VHRLLLTLAIATAALPALVGCDADGSASDTTAAPTGSLRAPSLAESVSADASNLREHAAAIIQNARRIQAGESAVHRPSFLGWEFECEQKVDPEISALRKEPRKLLNARYLYREACRRLTIAEREHVLGSVEQRRRTKARAEARLAERYARAARRALANL